MVDQLRAQFESAGLDKIPESPVIGQRGLPHHINGMATDSQRIPPPVPPKKKLSRDNGAERKTSDGISIQVTAASNTIQQQQQLEEELKMEREMSIAKDKELSLLRQQLRDQKKKEKRLQHKVDRYENSIKAKRAQESLKKWSSPQPSIPDLHQTLDLEELGDPQELIQQFVESERLYVNVLEAIHFFFYQPIQTMAIFKREIVPTQQFQAIFLNSPQLLVIHRLLYSQLCTLKYLPKDSRLEEFLVILERTVPCLSVYSGFQSEFFMQNLQRELSQWHSKHQISKLLTHLEVMTDGKTLADLMRIPAGRLSEYILLLKPFLEDRIRGTRYVNDTIIKRIQALNTYITSLQVELLDEKSEWDCIVEKHKVLMKLSTDGPIPLEMFNSDTKLVKQGPVMITEKGKEVQKTCFLFTTHIAVADKTQDHHVIFTENAMISLVGATLYENVDMAGQIIQRDILSGLEQDMLGFRINFCGGDYLILKVGRPNEKKQWVEHIEKTLEKISRSESSMDTDSIIPDVSPKIAAASLEKLFQHLTNPQIACRDDFIDVFLNTYPCFTTPKNVLTALLNCIKSPKEKTPDPSTQAVPNHVFTFNMDDNMDTVSCSISMTSMSANSQNYSSGSDSDSADSPETPRRQIPSAHTDVSTTPTPSSSKPPSGTNTVMKRTSISTDSDSSPYTSGVPIAVDTKGEAKNGWQEVDSSLVQTMPTKVSPGVGSVSTADSTYVTFHRPLSRESGSLGDTEDDDFTSGPRPSLGFDVSLSQPERECTDSLFSSVDSTIQRMRHSEDFTSSRDQVAANLYPPRSKTPQDDYSRRMEQMNEGLNGAHKMVDQVLLSLHEPSPPTECFDPAEDEENFKKYTGSSRKRHYSVHPTSSRLSTSSNLSFSEPDLAFTAIKHSTSLSDDRTPPPAGAVAEDELLTSLPATVARKFADPSPVHFLTPSPSPKRTGGRFSIGFSRSKKVADRSEKPRKSMPVGSQLHPSSSLYFHSQEPHQKSMTSPARAFGSIFKKKEKGKMNKSMSSNFTDGHMETTPKKSSRVRRNTSLGPIKLSPRYVNIDDLASSPSKGRERADDGSPRLGRRFSQTTSIRNFTLASKIFVVLTKWIETHFEDFQNDPELMKDLEEFLQATSDNDSLEESKLASSTLEALECIRADTQHYNLCFGNLLSRVTTLDVAMLEDIDWEKPAKMIVDKELDLGKSSRELGFLKTISEQISIILFAYYNAILRSELLNCNWKKKDKDTSAPNISRMIKCTNEMTSWICTEVLKRDTPQARAVVIEHFIYIAWHCYKHNDMHSALTITVALSSACIKRLSKSWDAVDRRPRQKYEKLKDATDHHEKCKKLRERLEEVTTLALEKTGDLPPALPYIGAYLEQIYILDIGLNTYNSDGLVNFVKMTKLSALIDTVLQYQQVPFPFEPKLDIIAYITSAKQLSDNELYDLSVAREPSKR